MYCRRMSMHGSAVAQAHSECVQVDVSAAGNRGWTAKWHHCKDTRTDGLRSLAGFHTASPICHRNVMASARSESRSAFDLRTWDGLSGKRLLARKYNSVRP